METERPVNVHAIVLRTCENVQKGSIRIYNEFKYLRQLRCQWQYVSDFDYWACSELNNRDITTEMTVIILLHWIQYTVLFSET